MLLGEALRGLTRQGLRVGILSSSLLTAASAWSQQDSLGSPAAFQFGFFVGADGCMLAPWQRTADEIPQAYRDSISSVTNVPEPGFSFGMLYERRMFQDLSVRVLPMLSFMVGSMDYQYVGGSVEHVSIERTEIGLAVQPLYCAPVLGKVRPYMALGASVNYSLDKDHPLRRLACRFEGGGGVRFPVAGVHCGVEMRVGKSLNDLLIRHGTLYTEVLERLDLNVFSLRIVLQG